MRSSVLIYRTDQYPVLKPVTDATLCISQNSDVQTLDLSANGLGSSGAKALVPQVASFSAMQVLDLAANDIGADGAQCLAPYLAGMARLQKLNLDANSIGVDGVQAIAQSLPRMTSLQVRTHGIHVQLWHRSLHGPSQDPLALPAQDFAGFQPTSKQRVHPLHCSYTAGKAPVELMMHDQILAHSVLVKTCSKVVAVLPGRHIAPWLRARCTAFSDGKQCCLQVLRLLCNDVGEEGAKELAKHLAGLTGLQMLYLNAKEIGYTGGVSVLETAASRGLQLIIYR